MPFKKKVDPEIKYAEALRLLAELSKLQGELIRSLINDGYVPPQMSDLLTFTFGMSTSANSLSNMIEAQTKILVAKAELDKM